MRWESFGWKTTAATLVAGEMAGGIMMIGTVGEFGATAAVIGGVGFGLVIAGAPLLAIAAGAGVAYWLYQREVREHYSAKRAEMEAGAPKLCAPGLWGRTARSGA